MSSYTNELERVKKFWKDNHLTTKDQYYRFHGLDDSSIPYQYETKCKITGKPIIRYRSKYKEGDGLTQMWAELRNKDN